MEPAHVVFLIGVALAVGAIALYLIAIAGILIGVSNNLKVILAAVSGVAERSAPAGPVIEAIDRDLADGNAAMAGAVQRLRERRAAETVDTGTPAPGGGGGFLGRWKEPS